MSINKRYNRISKTINDDEQNPLIQVIDFISSYCVYGSTEEIHNEKKKLRKIRLDHITSVELTRSSDLKLVNN